MGVADGVAERSGLWEGETTTVGGLEGGVALEKGVVAFETLFGARWKRPPCGDAEGVAAFEGRGCVPGGGSKR